MADKADEGANETSEDTERMSRKLEYLHRRRAAFKGVVTRNRKKVEEMVSSNGSRTVIRSVKERLMQALENANQVTQQIIALQADECKQAELEEWLDQLRTEVEDSVDKVEEYLERRAGAPLSVIGDFAADYASEIDDKTSQTSESSDISQASKAAEELQVEVAALTAEVAALNVKQEKKRLQEELELQERAAREIKIQQERDEAARLKEEAELLAQCRQSKEKKSVRNLISKDSNSSEEESDEVVRELGVLAHFWEFLMNLYN